MGKVINQALITTTGHPFVCIRALYHVELVYPATPATPATAATDPQAFDTPQEAAFAAAAVARRLGYELRIRN